MAAEAFSNCGGGEAGQTAQSGIARPATPSDHSILASIYADAFGAAYAHVASVDPDKLQAAMLAMLREPSMATLYEVDGRIKGFLLASADGHFIDKLYVLPGAQGRGIGRILMEHHLSAMAQVAPGEKVWLTTDEFNGNANALYRALGFEHYGLKHHGKAPDSWLLVFEKTLSSG